MTRLCLRCLELKCEETEATSKCTVMSSCNSGVRDVDLCDSCVKYMKKFNRLIKIYGDNEDHGFST